MCASNVLADEDLFVTQVQGTTSPAIEDAAVFVCFELIFWYHFFVDDPHPEKPVRPPEIVFGLDSVHSGSK